ncbi:S-layer homology domain-containing protein [Paenibacillus planticolens]|uniref:SLH domain-containing protein n=1 Tax=Paenibacillus planticolens TaxID=2654976 RepID=A0ABX1ZNQ8_9BACL|nr:S-layer homology domain-containing protein [Paenibacillus planticolens]NOV00650.1 hypothetical protein [Paenibacillus planticolens]
MKSLKKMLVTVFAIIVFIHSIGIVGSGTSTVHAAESDAPKLLSGNTLGMLLPDNTEVIATGAAYTWQQEGVHTTDPGILASDPSAKKMSDGVVSADIITQDKMGEAYGTLVYDLKSTYRLSSLQIWSEFTPNSGLQQVEVYGSLDGTHYNRVGISEITGVETGIVPITSQLKPAPYARYVKIILHKNPAKSVMRLGEVAIWGNAVDASAILSNNQLKADGYYNMASPKIDTKATYQWGTEQPFVTEPNLIATDNEAGAKNDGSPSGLPDLIDGSSLEETTSTTASMAAGSQGKYGTVTFNLNDMYLIDKIDVWTKADSSKFMDGYEVLLSVDNINYFSSGYTANPNNRYADAMVNTVTHGIPGKHAKYVRIVMHNANDSSQLVAGEIAIWGWKLYNSALTKKDTPDQVEVTTNMKNYNTLYLDWSAYNSTVNKVNKYSIYIQKSDFTTTSGLSARVTAENGSAEQKGKFLLISSLEPETTYYIAVTPTSSASGERKDVSAIRIQTPSVLGGEKAGDIFSINDTPYGGGNYVSHGSKEDANIISKLILLRNIEGINFSRWWVHDSWVKSFSNKYGIGFHTFYHGPQDVPLENSQGTWTFSTVNEPDLKAGAISTVASMANLFKANHASLKAVDSRNLLVEPALGGTEPSSMAWLNALYQSDGQNGALVKTYFDVMDVHPYVKNHEGSLPGLIPGAPEMLIGKITDIRALMAKYGDQDKPIIFSELGWSTYTGSGYLRPVDQVTQRNYLARAYMHAIAGGIKRMHWYDFQDDGLDSTNLEHNLGLIDWNGMPKKSYYAYYTMVKVLKDAKFIRTTPNVPHPYYSYEYWHEDNNQYVTSLWAADESTKTATFKTKDTGVTVVGIDGSYKYVPVNDGMASLTITGAPAFIYSSSGLEIMSIDDSFTLKDTSLDARRGDTMTTFISRSGMGVELNGRLELVAPSEAWKLNGDVSFTAGSTAIPISMTVPVTADEKLQDIKLNVISGTSVVASLKLKVNVLETIKVRMAPEPVEPGQWDQWDVVLYMENATPDKILNGSLSVTNAVYMAVGQHGPISFSGLKPGETKKIKIPITELPEKARAALTVTVALESGFTKVIERPFNFIAAVSDRMTPIIDGEIEEGWHKGMPIVINRPDQNKNIANWGGEDDLSGRGYLKWDRNYLYMAMQVKDDIHVQKGVGGDIWQGDSIQFTIDTGRVDGVGSSQNNEIGIALGEKGPIVWRWLSGNGKSEGELTNVQAAVYRSNTYTSYELAIPWPELLPAGRQPASGDILGFSMLINENDGTTRRGWLEYMSGIGSSKNTQLFEDMILSRVGLPDVSVEGVALDQPTIALDKGASASLTAIVTPDDATNIKVNFTSSNPNVVSVTQATYGGATATVTGIETGTATITVTTEDGHKMASSVVTVTEPIVVIPVTGVTLDQAELALKKGAAAFLTAIVNPDQASNKQVTFTSSDPEIVSVSQVTYGLQATVTGIQYGTATITVKTEDGGYTATSTVTVSMPRTDEESSYGGSVFEPTPQPTVHGGTIELPVPVVKQDDTAVVDVPMDSLKKAVEGAVNTEPRVVVIHIPEVQGAAQIIAKLPVAFLAAANDSDIERVEIRTGMATLSLAPDALREYTQTTSKQLEISIGLIDPNQLIDSAVKVGDKPVYDFHVVLDGREVETLFGKEAVRISVAYTLAPGESADQIISCHVRDNGTFEVIRNGTYDPATGKATFTVSHLGKFTVLYKHVTFQDLQDAAWAKGSIEALAAREIINGVGGGLFAPHAKVTRAEFIQMIINAFDLVDSNADAKFSDVHENDWYFQAVASAQKLGIVQGYEDGSFGVNREITRQEMAMMAYRALVVAEKQLKKTVAPASFADNEKISAFAREAVSILQEAGIINGMDEHNFAPELDATRAQAATIIYRIQKGVVQ